MAIHSFLQGIENGFQYLYFYIHSLTLETLFFFAVNAFIFYIVFQTTRMIFILLLNKQLAQISNAWTLPTNPGKKQILILGDSTAVGTGATSVQDSIAGRLMYDFPHAQITNLGKNGGLIRDVSEQIKQVSDQKFDLIIISAGGNDVVSLTRKKAIYAHLGFILKEALQMSNGRVFFLLYNNIGDAPIFPGFVRYFLKKRCKNIQNHIEKITYTMRVSLVEVFPDEKNNPFLKHPETFFAEDGIHPSSLGYKLWYHRMWLELVRQGFRL